MDCPHCSAENLLGATVCASCGKAMTSRPRFLSTGQVQPPVGVCDDDPERRSLSSQLRSSSAPEAGRAEAASWGGGEAQHQSTGGAAADLPAGPEAALCRICRAPYERSTDQRGTDRVCPGCAQITKMNPGADLGASDVAMHPATAPVEDFRSIREFRLAPVTRKARLRVGPIVALSCLVLGLATMGVVKLASSRTPSRIAPLLADARAESVDLRLAPESELPVRWETSISLTAMREESRGQFGSLAKVLDVTQTSTQTVDAVLVRTDDLGAVFDVRSEVRLGRQTGSVRGEDARDAELHPFGRHKGELRLRAHADAATASLDDKPLLATRDLPPFFAIGDLRVGARTVAPGEKWNGDVTLPVLADGSARLVPVTLRAEWTCVGRAIRSGFACAALRFRAPITNDTSTAVDEDFNRKQGEVEGAVFVELTTGLVVDASIVGRFQLRFERGKVENDLTVSTRIDVRRR